MTENSKAVAAASLAVLSWSTVAAAFKTALLYYSHYEMLTVAAATASVIFAIAVTLRGAWCQVLSLDLKGWLAVALLGAASPTVYYLVLFGAYDMLPAQVAQPVNYCWPVFLTLMLAALTRKPVRPRLYAGMAVSFVGVAVISLGGGGSVGPLSTVGIGLAFLSALLWAVYWILNEKLKGGTDESVKLFLSFLFGTLYLWAGTSFVPCDFAVGPGFWSSVYVGAFEMGVPFLFFSYALGHTSNVAAINQMCYVAPFLSLFFISLIVGESIAVSSYVGLVLIVGGVIYNKYLAYPSRTDASRRAV